MVFFLFLYAVYAVALAVTLGRRGYRARPPNPSAAAGRRRPHRILIVGATGGTGRELVAQALQRGHEVTALVRTPAKLQLQHPLLRVVRGDVLDYASVHDAVNGQDAVLSALGHKRFWQPTRILSAGTQNLLRAMDTHRVQRLICETSLGLGDSAGRMGVYYTFFVIPVILPFYFWDKLRQERAIAESGCEWIIVRPGALTNGAKRGTCRGGRIGSFLWTVRISRADVADFMLNQLSDDAFLRNAVGVCW